MVVGLLMWGGTFWGLWRWARQPPLLVDGRTRIAETPLWFEDTPDGLQLDYGRETILIGVRKFVLTPDRVLRDGKPTAVVGYRLARVSSSRAHVFTLSAILPDGSLLTLLTRTVGSRFSFDALQAALAQKGLISSRSAVGSERDVPDELRAIVDKDSF